MPGYTEARSLFAELDVPQFEPPRDALARILAERIKRSGLELPLEDVLTGEGLVRLEAEYERLDRDLRTTLLIAHMALQLAGPAYPDALGVEEIRAAVSYLSRSGT